MSVGLFASMYACKRYVVVLCGILLWWMLRYMESLLEITCRAGVGKHLEGVRFLLLIQLVALDQLK